MSHTDLGLLGSAQVKAAGDSLILTNDSGAIIPAGALLICGVISNNYASTSAPTLTTPTNNTGATWQVLAGPTGQGVTSTANVGIWGWSFYVYTTSIITLGQTIVEFSWSNSVDARAAVIKGHTGVSGAPYAIQTASNNFGNPATTTSASVTNGDLAVGIAFAENPTITGDSDTTNGSWTAIQAIGTTGGTSHTNVRVGIQDKEVTATATQTFNMTSGNDAIGHVCAFSMVSVEPISGNDTGSIAVSDESSIIINISATDSSSITINEYASKPNLQTFKDAITNRGSSRVNIGMLGASLTEGYPATADKTPAQYLANRLRNIYPTSGDPDGHGRLTIPTASMVGITPFTVTAGTGGNIGTSNATNGWGAGHQTWFSNGSLAVPPILVCTIPNGPWTSFDIDLLRVAGYSATAGQYRIDGGSWVNFALNTATGVVNEKLHVASSVTSTIEITIETGNASSYVIVNGITGYNNDESSGIQCHAFGHSGYRVNQWRVSANPTYDFRHDQSLEDLDLLVISDLGVNDAQTLTSAQFQLDLEDFFTYVTEVHTNIPIVMVSAWDMTAGVSYVEVWSNYRDVMQDFCETRGIPFIDLSTIMPATPNAIYHTDNTHGNTSGDAYRIMADIIAFAITEQSIDTSSIAFSEAATIVVDINSSDTAEITVGDVSTSESQLEGADSSSIAISDSSNIALTIDSTDSSSISITESSIVDIVEYITGSDSPSISISDSNELSASSISEDDSIISATDTSQLDSITTVTDTFAVSIVESSSILVTSSVTDSSSVVITDSSTLVSDISTSDSSILAISDSSSSTSAVVDSDTTALIIGDSTTIDSFVSVSDQWTVLVSDQSLSASTLISSDTDSVAISESTESDTSLSVTDTLEISIGDVSEFYKEISTTDETTISFGESASVNTDSGILGQDSGSLSISDIASISGTTDASDTDSFVITEETETTVGIIASDSSDLTIIEAVETTSALSQTDTSAINIVDSGITAIITYKEAGDTGVIIISETTMPSVEVDRSDEGDITISDSSSSIQTRFVSVTDEQAISVDDIGNIYIERSAADSTDIVITDSSSVGVVNFIESQDTFTISIEENTDIIEFNEVESGDTTTVSISEETDRLNSFIASDSILISISESTLVDGRPETEEVFIYFEPEVIIGTYFEIKILNGTIIEEGGSEITQRLE